MFGGSVFAEEAQPVTLTIEAAIDLALENNVDYLISRQEVKQSKARLRQNLGFLPQVTLEGTKTLNEKLMEIEISSDETGAVQKAKLDFTMDYEFTFQVVQPIFSGGKILFNLKNAALDVKLAKERFKQARAQLKVDVSKTFYNILVMKELLSAHQEAQKLAEANLKNVEERFNLGLVPKFDLLRAELSLASARPDLLKIKKLLRLSILNLKAMIGMPAETEIKIDGELDKQPFQLALEDIDKDASLRNSNILQMNMQVKKAANLLRIAYGQFLPDISLAASYSYRSNLFKLDKGNWEDYYTVALGIKIPIFTGLKRSGKVGELHVNKKIMRLRAKKVNDNTRILIQNLFLTIQEEYENAKAGLKNVEMAREGVKMAESAYKEGLISILELNSSNTEFFKAKVAYIQALYNYNIAILEIRKAAGCILE
jgi:outer membrane protein TolC